MSQAPLSKIVRALQHDDPAIRARGINALVRSPEASPDNIIQTLGELAGIDPHPDVRVLAKKRLNQYRQVIQSQSVSGKPIQAESFASDPLQAALPKSVSKPFASPMYLQQGTFILHPPNVEYVIGKREKPFLPSLWGYVGSHLLGLLMGLAFLAWGITDAKAYYDWVQIPASGSVVDIQFIEGGWEVYYDYTASDGSTQHGTYWTNDLFEANGLEIGDTVKLTFSDSLPEMVSPEKLEFIIIIALGIGSFLTLASAYFLFNAGAKMDQRQALMEKGKVIDAVVTSAELNLDERNARVGGGVASGGCLGGILIYVWTTHINPKHIMTVKYELPSPTTGEIVKGIEKYKRNDLKGKRPPIAGTPAKVLYVDEKNHFML